MANFPLPSNTFTGAQRVSPADDSEGGAALFALLNQATGSGTGAVVSTTAANEVPVIDEFTRYVFLLSSTDGASKPIPLPAVADTYAGQRITFQLLLRSSTGDYTLAVQPSTQTLNLTGETVTIVFDGTVWRAITPVQAVT